MRQISAPFRSSANFEFWFFLRSQQFRELDDEAAEKKRDDARKRSVPPKRLFDPTSIKEEDLERWGITSRRDLRERDKTVYEYEGFQFKGSFLTKFLPIRSLFTGPDILPELDELKIFEQAGPKGNVHQLVGVRGFAKGCGVGMATIACGYECVRKVRGEGGAPLRLP